MHESYPQLVEQTWDALGESKKQEGGKKAPKKAAAMFLCFLLLTMRAKESNFKQQGRYLVPSQFTSEQKLP